MDWLRFHFAGGGALYSGLALIVAAAAILWRGRRPLVRCAGYLFALTGVAAIGLSAAPLARWYFALWAASAAAGVGVASIPCRRRAPAIALILLPIVLGLLAAGHELLRLRPPRIERHGIARVYVIGDSISAGIGGEHGVLWPQVLAVEHNIEVVNLAVGGETLHTAWQRLEDTTLGDGLVLLEIGGNDLLLGRPAEQFERELEQLVARVSGRGRVLVMFELPLMPLRNDIGRAQRRVAARHGIELIPKRRFARVLTAPGNSLDGLHLSAAGQRAMAAIVWEMIGQAVAPARQ